MAATTGAVAIAASIACGGTDTSLAGYQRYYATVESAAGDLYRQSASATTPSAGAQPPVRTFAAALDTLEPPMRARDAHHDILVASRNLADVSALIADPSPQTTDDRTRRAGRETTFVGDWTRACHALQDVALAKQLDVDLHCTDALGALESR